MLRLKSSAPHVAATAFVLMTAWPSHANAQRHGHVHGPGGRSVVFVGGGFYPSFFYYDSLWYPWRPYGPYGPYGWYGAYGPYGPYGYGYGRYDGFSSDLRVEVSPREAEVFVEIGGEPRHDQALEVRTREGRAAGMPCRPISDG